MRDGWKYGWHPLLTAFGKKEWYGNRNISYIAGALCLGFF